VVIYDRLVDRRLLDAAPPRALRIFAGKASEHHARPQEQINDLLIAHARRGRRVVRLKGGDPFVFGRGGEEAEALAASGIPLTHREISSSFAVVTGHECAGKDGPGVNWAALATAVDTLVILMGLKSLPRIAASLIAHGRAPETPVAVVRAGTTDEQETVTGTLVTLAPRLAWHGRRRRSLVSGRRGA
jgi:siroheme synthase